MIDRSESLNFQSHQYPSAQVEISLAETKEITQINCIKNNI